MFKKSVSEPFTSIDGCASGRDWEGDFLTVWVVHLTGVLTGLFTPKSVSGAVTAFVFSGAELERLPSSCVLSWQPGPSFEAAGMFIVGDVQFALSVKSEVFTPLWEHS